MTALTAAAPPAPGRRRDRWQFWGRMLVLPYMLVFLVFVLYPVGYGLWLARHPSSYQKLFEDPIFFRTVVNTLVFLVVAINVKMVIAMVLSGFFVTERWWIRILSLIFILPWALPSIPTILSVRFISTPSGA
jgi:multiple sugar transport system permease protein